jgi:hypothetical protein
MKMGGFTYPFRQFWGKHMKTMFETMVCNGVLPPIFGRTHVEAMTTSGCFARGNCDCLFIAPFGSENEVPQNPVIIYPYINSKWGGGFVHFASACGSTLNPSIIIKYI